MPEIFDASEKQTPVKTTSRKDPKSYSQVIRDNSQSDNPLDAFALRPTSVVFDSQLEDEEVLLLLRQHPITQIKWIFIIGMLLLVPFLLSLVSFWDMVPGKYHFFGLVFWYLLVLGITLEAFLSWFYNVYIVTDERVIDVDFLSLIYKNISAAKLDNIEDVTATTTGAIQSVFNIGTVKIQTAAEVTEFEFENVPQPDKVTTLLNELLLEEEREKMEGRVN